MSLTIEEKTNTQKKELSPVIQSVIQMGILLVISFNGMFIMILVLVILIRNMPGSPYMFMLGENPTQSQIAAYNAYIEYYGLDKPVISQFFIFYWNTISRNWGVSSRLYEGFPVKEIIIKPYFRFLEFNFISFCFSLLLCVVFRVLVKKFNYKKYGKLKHVIKYLNWAIVVFGLGMLLQYTFGYKLKVLPSTSFYDPNVTAITHFRLLDCLIAGDFVALWNTILHLIMPVFCQSFIMVSFIIDLRQSIMDFYKSPKEMHYFSGKIAFYLSFIFTTTLLLENTFNDMGMGNLITNSSNSLDLLVLSASIYQILLTFLIINIFINIFLHIIRISKFGKISETENNLAANTISSDHSISESSSNSLETVSESTLEENTLVLDKKTDNEESIGKEIFRALKIKLSKPLAKIGIITVSILIIIAIVAIFVKLISPYETRDISSQWVFGIQTALKVGFISTLIGMPLGVLMGTISAFFGKWVKYIIDTINGMILVIPGYFFAYLILSIIGPNIGKFYWILGLVNIPIATLLTQQVISYEMKKGDIIPSDFSKTNGKKILSRLPNIILSILGVGCLIIGLTILLFESLNFLGVSDYMTVSLGNATLLGQTRLISAPWAAFWPASWIYITVLSFIMLGIGLKEE